MLPAVVPRDSSSFSLLPYITMSPFKAGIVRSGSLYRSHVPQCNECINLEEDYWGANA